MPELENLPVMRNDPFTKSDPAESSTFVPNRYGLLMAVALSAMTLLAGACGEAATTNPAAKGPAPASSTPAGPQAPSAAPAGTTIPSNEVVQMEINKAVMVTVELDYGGKPPSIAEAMRDIERRSQPVDGQGRTFAILDAYGEPTADGKLHLSMHVSSEKPGIGSLYFKRTGAQLWQANIAPGAPSSSPVAGKQLKIFLDDGKGGQKILDGSNNPTNILGAIVNETKQPVRDVWPDGAEREFTFVYSACGCPVKVMVRRTGETTVRTKELPVIFPDDPAVAESIRRLMGWAQ